MTPSGLYWRGQAIETLTREEAIEALTITVPELLRLLGQYEADKVGKGFVQR